jgi:hypothetical protein
MFKNKFDAGELDKWCLAAVDDPLYQRGAAWLENFNILEMGGLNRRKGYKHIKDILAGTDDGAVKLIPFQVDDVTTYLVYFSKSKLGYLKFNKYDLVDSYERNPPISPIIPDANVFQYYAKDPNAYYYLKDERNADGVITKYAIENASLPDDTPVGAELEVSTEDATEKAVAVVMEKVESDEGKLLSIVNQWTGHDDKNYILTPVEYDRSWSGAVYAVIEAGQGTGLNVTAVIGQANSKGIAKVTFTVVNGGEGFANDTGLNYTLLRVKVLDQTLVVKAICDPTYGRVMVTSKNLLFFSVPLQFFALRATKHAFLSVHL